MAGAIRADAANTKESRQLEEQDEKIIRNNL
jgi:hypothetical protein